MIDIRKILIALFVISFLIFITPTILRWSYFHTPGIIGFPTYFHQRMAQSVADGTFNWYDTLSFGGRFYSYYPLFIFSIAVPAFFIGAELAGLITIALFGALAVMITYLLSNHFIKERRLMPIVLLFTPGMIFIFSHVSSRGPPIALGLLALYLIIKKYPKLAGIAIAISALFHIETGLIFFILSILMLIKDKKNLFYFSAIAFIISAVWYIPFLVQHGFPSVNILHHEYRVNEWSLEPSGPENYFFEIGSGYFTIPLALLTIYGLWKVKNNYLRFWFLFTFALTLVAERFMMYMPIPMIMLSVAGLYYICKKIRFNYAVILMALFIVYTFISGILYAQSFASSYPTAEQYSALKWIKENSKENDTVLSYWIWGHWIAGISERKNIMDGYAEYAPQADERYADTEVFFKNCSEEFLDKYDADFIYLERWFIEKRNMTCIYKFNLVFNGTQSMVFRR